MRLIKTETGELREFFDADIPPYAILSHKWGTPDDELSYSDYVNDRKHDRPGFKKIQDFCRVARELEYDWAWIDTCCIDKSSSSEQSEAINSMFAWYKSAQLCIVHLADVSDSKALDSFGNSVWFSRGWTLQELLAPSALTFYTADWQVIGKKDSPEISQKLSQVTGIPHRMLTSPDILHNVSVARRMSWAAGRQTSRTEDLAYCLLGIFDINMPLLYGEGQKAFYRLQMEIMDQLDDESLFAWQDDPSTAQSATHGLLAKSPSKFAACGNIVSTQTSSRLQSPPIRMTSRGAEVFSELSETYSSTAEGQPIFVYTLGCGTSDKTTYCLDMQVGGNVLREGRVKPCSIALVRRSEGLSFTRIDAGQDISNLTSKYEHAVYVRPQRFYIRTSWSGAATFTKIFNGKQPSLRSVSPGKLGKGRSLGKHNQTIPSRALTTKEKLTSFKLESLRASPGRRKDSTLERRISDQRDQGNAPMHRTSLQENDALGTTKEMDYEELLFTSPEFLQTETLSRNRSRRSRTLHSERAVAPLENSRRLSFSQDTDETIESVIQRTLLADNNVVAESEVVEPDSRDLSPVNSIPELEMLKSASVDKTNDNADTASTESDKKAVEASDEIGHELNMIREESPDYPPVPQSHFEEQTNGYSIAFRTAS